MAIETKRLIGYARVSTLDQELTRQTEALESAGCSLLFQDKASGAKEDRPGLERALAELSSGDVLVVCRLDRLGRSLTHLVSVVEHIRELGAYLRSLADGEINTTTASGRLVFHVFAAMAEFERGLASERIRAGIETARRQGRVGGRPVVNRDDDRVQTALAQHRGKRPVKDIARSLGVHRATVHRWIQRYG